mgnify:FL=1
MKISGITYVSRKKPKFRIFLLTLLIIVLIAVIAIAGYSMLTGQDFGDVIAQLLKKVNLS